MAIYLGSNQVRAAIMPDGLPNIQSLSISQNGTYSISGNINGYNPITVNVLPTIQSLTISQNGTYSVTSGIDGYSPITVDILPNIQSLTVSENGVYTAGSSINGFNPVTVTAVSRPLSSVLAYAGVSSIGIRGVLVIGYDTAIIFSNVSKQPDMFFIILTPQLYNGSENYCQAVYNGGTFTNTTAICNIIYNGTVTSTYLTGFSSTGASIYFNDNGFTNAYPSSTYLTNWNYDSTTQQMICSINSDWIGSTYFATAGMSSYGNYPAPAYTLYYM